MQTQNGMQQCKRCKREVNQVQNFIYLYRHMLASIVFHCRFQNSLGTDSNLNIVFFSFPLIFYLENCTGCISSFFCFYFRYFTLSMGFPRWRQWKRTRLPMQEMQERRVQSLGWEDLLEEGQPFQFSCLENPTDREVWRVTVHRAAKNQTGRKQLSMHSCILRYV